jgi:hypothetical protein
MHAFGTQVHTHSVLVWTFLHAIISVPSCNVVLPPIMPAVVREPTTTTLAKTKDASRS